MIQKKTPRALLILSLALTGCAETRAGALHADDGAARAPRVYAQDAILDGAGSADFLSEPSPRAVAAKSRFVLEGVVDGLADGRSEVQTNEQGQSERDRFVVIRVRVSNVLKGSRAKFPGGIAYLTLPRGVQTYDQTGTIVPGGDVAVPIDAFQHDIPPGARILVLASPVRGAEGTSMWRARAGVLDASTPIVDVSNPQTILLDRGPESSVRGWQNDPSLTFDHALSQVRSALGATP
ncbi:hypothetical protein GCM10022237_17100 [Nocardioides ginsengisoli]|uniref:DUF4352 domain-containing protein n=1 Tax=Nocardioides ginsengisoli TaxID=363868 RepID=A0ABW3VYA0_9ACTN